MHCKLDSSWQGTSFGFVYIQSDADAQMLPHQEHSIASVLRNFSKDRYNKQAAMSCTALWTSEGKAFRVQGFA